MELEKQVCSLELAQKLKELGVVQESYFQWYLINDADGEYPTVLKRSTKRNRATCADYCPAYTVAELGEMLPKQMDNHYKVKQMYPFQKGSQVHLTCYFNERSNECGVNYNGRMNLPNDELDQEQYWYGELANTEADARAKMLIYLLENKLITV